MPLYEYECEACGKRFEKIQKFSDPLVESCPSCGGGPVQKLLSSPAIQFKGSGWYITDYPKKDASTAAKSDGDTDSKAASGDAKEAKDTKGAGESTAKETKEAKETKAAPDTKTTKASDTKGA